MADDRYSQLDVEHEESFDLPSTGAVRARPGATATPTTTTTENKLIVNNKKYLELCRLHFTFPKNCSFGRAFQYMCSFSN